MIHAIILQKVQAILQKAATKFNYPANELTLWIGYNGQCNIIHTDLNGKLASLDKGTINEMLEKYN
jgi:hypothetical protein